MGDTKKKSLEPHEKETSVHFDRSSDVAFVFTYERSWQTHFKRVGMEPTSDNGYGGLEYEIPKEWIRLPRPRTRRKK